MMNVHEETSLAQLQTGQFQIELSRAFLLGWGTFGFLKLSHRSQQHWPQTRSSYSTEVCCTSGKIPAVRCVNYRRATLEREKETLCPASQ